VTGPPLRASGVDWDLRRDMPYSSYEKFQVQGAGLNDGRCLGALRGAHAGDARVGEDLPAGAGRNARTGPIVADAPKIVLPDREQMKTQMESLITTSRL
jgi:NADH-quinone oxidoreductase subunit D